jgi:hypothetical protein
MGRPPARPRTLPPTSTRAGRHDPSTGLPVRLLRLAERGGVVVAEVNLIGAAVNAEPNRLATSSLEVCSVEVVDERGDRALCDAEILPLPTAERRRLNDE